MSLLFGASVSVRASLQKNPIRVTGPPVTQARVMVAVFGHARKQFIVVFCLMYIG